MFPGRCTYLGIIKAYRREKRSARDLGLMVEIDLWFEDAL